MYSCGGLSIPDWLRLEQFTSACLLLVAGLTDLLWLPFFRGLMA